jgi:hypothetical protein
MSRDDKIDLTFLTLALLAAAGILFIQYMKPLPLHRRVLVQVKARLGR